MDDEKEGDKFCEEDIDQILQRRTQTITIESGVKGSSFAKVCGHINSALHKILRQFSSFQASFSVSTNRSDIDINDPNFWQKWAKKAHVDVDHNPEVIV